MPSNTKKFVVVILQGTKKVAGGEITLFLFARLHTKDNSDATDQGACVSGVSRGVVQEAREAKVGDLADQVAVDQDIPRREVSVHVVHV